MFRVNIRFITQVNYRFMAKELNEVVYRVPSVTVLVSNIVKEDLKFLVSLVWNSVLRRIYDVYIWLSLICFKLKLLVIILSLISMGAIN